MPSLHPLPLLLAAFLSTAAAAPVSGVEEAAAAPHYFFTFGDSYSQTGFDIALAKPSAANPIGNPAYPGYTTAGGPNWLDYLTTTYNRTQVLTYNFAYGGATVDAALVPPYMPSVQSLVDQVAIFDANVAAKPAYAPWTAETSTFGIWIGINDIGNSWYLSGEEERVARIVARLRVEMGTLYEAGARRVVVLSVPPVTRSPTALLKPAADRAAWQSALDSFNTQLSSALDAFRVAHPDAAVWAVDTVPVFEQVLDHPTLYGAPDATCYDDDGKSCLWWNDYHPGVRIQEEVAKVVAGVVGAPFGGDGEICLEG